MPISAALKDVIEELASMGVGRSDGLSVDSVRGALHCLKRYQGDLLQVQRIDDILIEGSEVVIPVRVYTPRGEPPFPVVVYFQGGGWVSGDLESADTTCRVMAYALGSVIVSVAYRLSPESKFPKPLLDCYEATGWAARHRSDLDCGDGPLFVLGESAGGNLAASVALASTQRREFELAGQVLLYPALDPSLASLSQSAFADCYLLTRELMGWYWRQYLPDARFERDPLAAPIRAACPATLPETFIVTAEYDILRDEAEGYADRLRRAGLNVRLSRYPGMIHGFLQFRGRVDAATALLEEIRAWCLAVAAGPRCAVLTGSRPGS